MKGSIEISKKDGTYVASIKWIEFTSIPAIGDLIRWEQKDDGVHTIKKQAWVDYHIWDMGDKIDRKIQHVIVSAVLDER